MRKGSVIFDCPSYDPQQKANNKRLADMPKTVKLNARSEVMDD